MLFRVYCLGHVPRELGLSLLDGHLVGTRIYLKEQVALLYILAFPEMNIDHLPANLGLHRYGVECLDIADGIDLDRDVHLNHVARFYRHYCAAESASPCRRNSRR